MVGACQSMKRVMNDSDTRASDIAGHNNVLVFRLANNGSDHHTIHIQAGQKKPRMMSSPQMMGSLEMMSSHCNTP